MVAAGIDDDAEPALDLREILSIRTDERRSGAIVVEIDDDLRLGRYLHVAVKFAAGNERGRIRCAFGQGFRLRWSLGKRQSLRRSRQALARARRTGCSVPGCRS